MTAGADKTLRVWNAADGAAVRSTDTGAPVTGYMKFGDRVRIEMRDAEGRTIFGAIDQKVVQA